MESSGTEYSDSSRVEVSAFLPNEMTSMLDIGCYKGAFGAYVKQTRPTVEVWGIEADAAAAATAATRLDHVLCGEFPQTIPTRRFDCVVFNDVLEHLIDPMLGLRIASSLLGPNGEVVASIPNVRHFSVTGPVVLKGRWNYRDRGILDYSHLRFFTRSSMIELFRTAGYRVKQVQPVNVSPPVVSTRAFFV